MLDALSNAMDHLDWALIALAGFHLVLGITVLATRRVPRWLRAAKRWKPLGWSSLCCAAWLATLLLPRALNATPETGTAVLILSFGFLIPWIVLNIVAGLPPKSAPEGGGNPPPSGLSP
ncbi:hypothetical protein ACWEPC_35570 [Nonomuraea sp. NPDC004297]